MKENLSAPGELMQWFDGCIYALKKGDFTGIRVTDNRHRITANYGADKIVLTLFEKDVGHIYLSIDATAADVLKWFKSCVTDVMLHPQQGFNEGLSQSAYNRPRQAAPSHAAMRPVQQQPLDDDGYEPTRAFNPYDAARQAQRQRYAEQAYNREVEQKQAYQEPYPDQTADLGGDYNDDYLDDAPYDDDADLFEEAPQDNRYQDDYQDDGTYPADDTGNAYQEDDAAYDYYGDAANSYYDDAAQAKPQTFKEKFDALCQKKWFILIMVLLVAPFGIYLLWRGRPRKSFLRILATAGAVAYFLFIWLGFFGVNTGLNRQTFTNMSNRQKQQTQSNVNKTPDSTDDNENATNNNNTNTDNTANTDNNGTDNSSSTSTVLDQMVTNIQNNLSNMFGHSAQ